MRPRGGSNVSFHLKCSLAGVHYWCSSDVDVSEVVALLRALPVLLWSCLVAAAVITSRAEQRKYA